MAINNGSIALTIGEAAIVADETPNKEATGLTHTPTQAPPLHTENKIGTMDANPPVIVVQIVFFSFITRSYFSKIAILSFLFTNLLLCLHYQT